MNEPQKKKGGSGEHPVVREFRRKLDSIAENTIPAVDELLEKIDRAEKKSSQPPKDPRREPDDDSAIHFDVVDPFPESERPTRPSHPPPPKGKP